MLWREGARPLVMGIVNVTPDSFSGDGQMDTDFAAQRAMRLVEEGANILDIGGESTRPDAAPVSVAEEIARVVPVIARIRQETDTLISIDTMKAAVAEAALREGADIINDVSGGQHDPAMLALAADRECPIVLMHNRANWQEVHGRMGRRSYNAPAYDDFMSDILREMREIKDTAVAAGVAAGNIILDPGIGFGKTIEQNCQIIRDLARFKSLGCPLLVGASRKSFIGRILDLNVDERVEGTAAAVALAVAHGAAFLRVHDVKEMRRVVDMSWAIVSP